MSSTPYAAPAALRNPGRNAERLVTAFVLMLYVLAVVLVLPRHEPFGDEQNAWILAAHNPLAQLFSSILRHEGTPGLWHSMLWLCARLHLTFLQARWLAAVFPVAGVYVLLRFAPFPLWLRALLPFTFFLVYQYAVVARQYVLFPLLAFSLAALVCARRWRPWLYAVCAGLLANDSLHGFCFVLGFTAAAWLLRRRLAAWPDASSAARLKPAGPVLLLAALLVVAVVTALPLPRYAAAIVTGGARSAAPATPIRAVSAVPLEAPSDTPWLHTPPAGMNAVQTAIWRATMLRQGLAPATRQAKALHALIIAVSLLAFPIAEFNLLAFLFLAAVLVRLSRQRTLVLLLPYVLLWLVLLFLHGYEHHTGLLLLALLAALWVSYRIDPPQPLRRDPTLLLLGLVAVLQVAWGMHALTADYRQPYTGDQAAALSLRLLPRGASLARGPIAIDLATPDFTRHIETPSITARTPAYDGDELASMRALEARLALHPGYVLEGAETVGPDSLKNQITPMSAVGGADYSVASQRILQAFGYRETRRFCGDNFMRLGYSRRLCQILYQPAAAPVAAPAF